MVFSIGNLMVQQVSIFLIVCKNEAEHRYRSIVLPAEKPVNRGWHVGNDIRPRRPEYEFEEIQGLYFFFFVVFFVVVFFVVVFLAALFVPVVYVDETGVVAFL